MRVSAFFVIVLGLLIQAAALPIVRDEIERRSSSLYHSTFLPPLAGAPIDISESISESISKVEEVLKEAVDQIVTSAGAMVKTLQNIDPKEFRDQLDVALSRVFEELQNEFSEPLPEDKTERYKRQETMINQALEKIEDAVVDVCRTWEISEDTVRADFNKVKPHLTHAHLIVAKLVNNHPDLILLLCSSVIIGVLPEGFILWPILRFFGFSRLGPVKGSIAARAQSFFFGAKVPKGGLFAWLQSVGMKMKGVFLAMWKLLWPF